jgi:hypothetical protein
MAAIWLPYLFPASSIPHGVTIISNGLADFKYFRDNKPQELTFYR